MPSITSLKTSETIMLMHHISAEPWGTNGVALMWLGGEFCFSKSLIWGYRSLPKFQINEIKQLNKAIIKFREILDKAKVDQSLSVTSLPKLVTISSNRESFDSCGLALMQIMHPLCINKLSLWFTLSLITSECLEKSFENLEISALELENKLMFTD